MVQSDRCDNVMFVVVLKIANWKLNAERRNSKKNHRIIFLWRFVSCGVYEKAFNFYQNKFVGKKNSIETRSTESSRREMHIIACSCKLLGRIVRDDILLVQSPLYVNVYFHFFILSYIFEYTSIVLFYQPTQLIGKMVYAKRKVFFPKNEE